MGRAILRTAFQDPEIEIAGAFERSDSPVLGKDVSELIGEKPMDVPVHPDVYECIKTGDVLIDFTQPGATSNHLKAAVDYKKAIVICTTGLPPSFFKKSRECSSKIPIVQSPNMSLGVNLLFRLSRLVAEKLSDVYDVEITEAHHRHKKDAPSGTALEIARLIAAARKVSMGGHVEFGRKGVTSARQKGAIGIHAIRGGDVVGEHTVSFMADGERLELIHRASSREAFARGAILAAKFVAKKRSGLYNMEQVLGLS